MSNKNLRLTLGDFSNKLGISTATVSSVFNNRHKERGISPKTVEFVKSQAKKLGYQPNIAAKRLSTRQQRGTYELAVLTSYESPIHISSNLVHTLESTAKQLYKEFNFCLDIVMFHAGHISEVPGILDGSRFNGAIISNTNLKDDSFFVENELMYPVVFLGREIPNYSCVMIEPFEMGVSAAIELIDNCNCSRPGVIIPEAEALTQATKGRFEGFMELCKSRKVDFGIIKTKGLDEKAAAEAFTSYIQSNQIDGIFAVSDFFAIGAYFSAKQNNLSIPEDLAVVSVGDIAMSAYMDPPITGFNRLEANKQDFHAAKLLLEQLLGQNKSPVTRIMNASIIRRGSSQRSA
jgi:DNA-binding LacI/PurR family transcriptional regulator